jgi:hypothetical protein
MKITYYDLFIPRPDSGEVLLTINMKDEDLEYLIEKKYGEEFFAKDESALPDDNAIQNIQKLYGIIGIDLPDKFTSLAIRTDFNNACWCECYGPIVLYINKDEVSDDIIIFNGDVQELAHKILTVANPRDWVKIHKLKEVNLYNSLKEIYENGQPENNRLPRIVGGYFEARLHRALKYTDIDEILIPRNRGDVYEKLMKR